MIKFFPIIAALISAALNLTAPKLSHAQTQSTPSLYHKGYLNPAYMSKAARLLGEVVEVQESVSGKQFFKLDVRLKGVSPIWVSTFAPVIEGTVKVGDRYVFIGHVRTPNSLDPSGELKKFIQSPTLLIARSIQTPK